MLSQMVVISVIVVCCVLSLLYSLLQFFLLKGKANNAQSSGQLSEQNLERQQLLQNKDQELHVRHQEEQKINIQKAEQLITQGAKYYFGEQAKIVLLFAVVMAIVLAVGAEQPKKLWITTSFILGCITSFVGAWIALEVSLIANTRCATLSIQSVSEGFKAAFQAGVVVGFSMISIGVLVLLVLIAVFLKWNDELKSSVVLFSSIAGFGLGTSTIAFFGRVGGGIFAKSADISADLVGKVEPHILHKQQINEDSTLNACTIADAVGDNINDAVGMATDLYGSLIEAICAAFLLSTQSAEIVANSQAQYYPLLIVSLGLIPCIITSALPFMGETTKVKSSLNVQQIISALLMIPFLYLAVFLALPDTLSGLSDLGVAKSSINAFFCTILGLVCAELILIFNKFFTSNEYLWVRQIVNSCITGAATNVIFGVALGSKSTIISIFSLVFISYFSHFLLGAYGVALAAIGMISNFSIRVAIDYFNPVADNAQSITRQCQLVEGYQNVDQLDIARNDVSADCKAYSVGLAGLVSIAVYGAYLSLLSQAQNYPIQKINVISPLIFSCVLLGAMLPYVFSAMCMKSVCKISKELQKEVREQLANPNQIVDETKPSKCVISNTSLSLRQQFLPLLLTLLSPLMFGLFIGPQAVVGIIPGAIISGVSMAASQVNSGCAWECAKKWLERKSNLEKLIDEDNRNYGNNEQKLNKKREKHLKLGHADTIYASVVGDLVGDIQKSTSGPGLNILMKFMAIFAVACFRLFDSRAVLECVLAPNSAGCK